ncbi:hypothetical protein IT774_07795 [Salinimonas marina]|uniref:Stress protein n=1 Tax=Salinimonas marina TaxID=2785918 RepID=A0A7S9HEL0_9ALTE|nr:hypothetical protein [Salinimonas marina]QPG06997.1 hypothetical protein IT774_07795 [Salinimonas marina]
MSNTNQNPQGDRLEKTLAGDYEFSVKHILLRANNLVKNHYPLLIAGCGVILLVVAILMAILVSRFSLEGLTELSQSQQAFIDVVVIFLMAPITTGLILLASDLAANRPVRFQNLFDYLPQILSLAVAQLFVSILVQLGLYLLIVPGMYVFMASVFTLPIIAQRKVPVTSALMLSFKVVNRYLSGFISLFGIFILLLMLSAFTLGLAMLWVMPLYYATVGLLFNDLFGSQTSQSASEPSNNESTFDA